MKKCSDEAATSKRKRGQIPRIGQHTERRKNRRSKKADGVGCWRSGIDWRQDQQSSTPQGRPQPKELMLVCRNNWGDYAALGKTKTFVIQREKKKKTSKDPGPPAFSKKRERLKGEKNRVGKRGPLRFTRRKPTGAHLAWTAQKRGAGTKRRGFLQ